PSRASQKTAKLDHSVTQRWRASLSYARYFSLEPGNTWFATVSSPDQWRLLRRVDATQFNNIMTLSPTTVLTVRYGLNRFPDYRRIHDDGNDFANSAGAFTVNGVFSRSTPLTAVAGTGADMADMLLGTPSAGTGYIPSKLYEYANYYGAYAQDDIRLTKSLTI